MGAEPNGAAGDGAMFLVTAACKAAPGEALNSILALHPGRDRHGSLQPRGMTFAGDLGLFRGRGDGFGVNYDPARDKRRGQDEESKEEAGQARLPQSSLGFTVSPAFQWRSGKGVAIMKCVAIRGLHAHGAVSSCKTVPRRTECGYLDAAFNGF